MIREKESHLIYTIFFYLHSLLVPKSFQWKRKRGCCSNTNRLVEMVGASQVGWKYMVRSKCCRKEQNALMKSINSSLNLFLSTPSFYLIVYVFVSFSFSCKLLLFRPSEPLLGRSQPTTSVPCFLMTATKRRGRVASTVGPYNGCS